MTMNAWMISIEWSVMTNHCIDHFLLRYAIWFQKRVQVFVSIHHLQTFEYKLLQVIKVNVNVTISLFLLIISSCLSKNLKAHNFLSGLDILATF
jgi:hypothetical protein